MICEQHRNKLLVAKSLYNDGTISESVLLKCASEYRKALLAARRSGVQVGGKPLWVPRSPEHLIRLTIQ